MQKKNNFQKKKYCFYPLALALILFLSTAFSAEAAERTENAENVAWRLDAAQNATLPRNLRFMTDKFVNTPKISFSRQGLDKLRCSAGAEFSGSGLSLLKKEIMKRAGSDSIVYIVDLRKESHGFVNGNIPVSAHVERNWGNYALSAEQTLKAEANLLQSLIGKEMTFIPMGNADTKLLGKISVKVEKAEPEEATVKKLGLRYKRIFATDQAAPTDENIDEFIKFCRSLPDNAWLHFHCQAGHGRTTAFAVFYDILKNPDVSLEDIAARQYALGGSNILDTNENSDWRANENRKRADKARKFYEYVQANRASNFAKTFSQWVNK